MKEEKDLALVEERTTGYNEALLDAADEIKAVEDQIYKGGYMFGLESAGLPREHELFEKVVLCPPGAFAVPSSAESDEETDEEEDQGHYGVTTAKGEVGGSFFRCNEHGSSSC